MFRTLIKIQSARLLVRHGFNIVLESNKVVITKNDSFVGKGYLVDGLFSLIVVNFDSNKSACSLPISSSVSNVECCGTGMADLSL